MIQRALCRARTVLVAVRAKVHHITVTDVVNVAVMGDLMARVRESSCLVAIAVATGYLILAIVFRDPA